jgi:hypothetical protein
MATFHRFDDDFSDEARARGLIPVVASAFDHGLSQDEYIAASFVSYSEAKRGGFLANYMKIEANFLRLLDALAVNGVSRIRFPHRLHALNPKASRYRKIVQRGLRDKFTDELYFHGPAARLVFNWDLTHWFFLRREEDAAALIELVKASGLHVLEPSPSKARSR